MCTSLAPDWTADFKTSTSSMIPPGLRLPVPAGPERRGAVGAERDAHVDRARRVDARDRPRRRAAERREDARGPAEVAGAVVDERARARGRRARREHVDAP